MSANEVREGTMVSNAESVDRGSFLADQTMDESRNN